MSAKWFILGLFAAAALALGCWGFSALGESLSRWDIIYNGLRLFTLEWDGHDNIGWHLQVARFMAPATTLVLSAMGLTALFRERYEQWMLRFRKDHIVICGLGNEGLHLLRQAAERTLVVVIERDEHNDNLATADRLKAVVLFGDATDADLLRKARVEHAEHVFVVCGDDGVNIETTVRVHDRVTGVGQRRVRCHVHLVDIRLCELFKRHNVFLERRDRFDARIYNVHEEVARKTLLDHKLDHGLICDVDDPRSVHLLIVGFGNMGQALALQAAKVAHFANAKGLVEDGRLRITVIDRAAATLEREFLARYPNIRQVCHLDFLAVEFRDPDTLQSIRNSVADSTTITTVIICFFGYTQNITSAFDIAQHLQGDRTPILIRIPHRTHLHPDGWAKIGVAEDNTVPIIPYGLDEEAFSIDNLIRPGQDRVARAIYADYRARTPLPTRDWGDLDPENQDSNRSQADHIPVKLSAIDANLRADEAAPTVIPEACVEKLARMEHNRWWATKLLAGWSLGVQDEAARTNPHMKKWTEICETQREGCRTSVRRIPVYLQSSHETTRPPDLL